MKNLFIIVIIYVLFLNAVFANDNSKNYVDCITLEDENSIICKYVHDSLEYDKNVTFRWIEPNGTISRQRDITLPAGHISIYDFRYLSGRSSGKWSLEVIDNNNTFKTNFIVE